MAMKRRTQDIVRSGAGILFWTAAIVLVFDIVTKSIIRATITLNDSFAALPFLHIVHFQNTGISFGLLQFGFLRWLYVAIALGVTLAIAVSCKRHKLTEHLIAWGLIMGGALGNALDRIFIGTVTDFAHFGIPGTTLFWPAFNVADAALTIGAIVIIWHAWRKEA